MKRDLRLFLEDIIESINKIEEYVEGADKDALASESWLQDAVTRRIEIIGEAAKNVPEDFRKIHPQIEWKNISGMRDKITHAYFGINFERVWLVVKDDLPDLRKKIKKILEEMETISE